MTDQKHLENGIGTNPIEDNHFSGIGMESNAQAQTCATMTPKAIAAYLGISLSGAYNLMDEKDFPSFRVGRKRMVEITSFQEWLKEQKSSCTDYLQTIQRLSAGGR